MENGEKIIQEEHKVETKEITQEQLDQEIRERANQIYLERGTKPGSALEDWLQAEMEIRFKYKIH